MNMLTNDLLLDTYYKAMDLKLDPEFIELLLQEIEKRQLNSPRRRKGA